MNMGTPLYCATLAERATRLNREENVVLIEKWSLATQDGFILKEIHAWNKIPQKWL